MVRPMIGAEGKRQCAHSCSVRKMTPEWKTIGPDTLSKTQPKTWSSQGHSANPELQLVDDMSEFVNETNAGTYPKLCIRTGQDKVFNGVGYTVLANISTCTSLVYPDHLG